jgi:hypothetical protein
MKPTRTRRAPKWQLSVANVFALLRERCLELDTIPKPGGLGFASALRNRRCPAFVQRLSPVLSTFCSTAARGPE